MKFAEPAFLFAALLALPVLAVAVGSRAPLPRLQLRLLGLLQALAIVAAAVALARPWTEAAGGPVHRFVVWAGDVDAGTVRAVAARRALQPRTDPFTVVRAGAAPVFGEPGAVVVPPGPGTPDLGAALRAVAAAIPAGAAAEVVLCTDGVHDGEALARAANDLTLRGVPVHVHRLPAPAVAPLRLLGLAHAVRTGAGEALRIDAAIEAARPGPVRLEVFDGEQLVGAADARLRAGEQVRSVDIVLHRPGPVELEVRLAGAADPAAGRERSAVFVDAGLRVLHLAADRSRREVLAAALRGHGIAVTAPDPRQLDPAAFGAAGAVLVDDLPAGAWPEPAQRALRDELLARGTGLVLAGTHQNLGPGGYATSPLQDVLPVRMPQREERRDPSVALVLIVDSSGSMGGGRLELAKEVARLALQKLQPHDKVGLIEFHGSKRWAAPLQPATNTIEVTRALNRLQVGGGTIIFDALEEAHFALLNAQTRFQHVLVLTDGGVESGPFEGLARRMAQAGQTVSTVLIGPQANSPFLLNLAQWGRGRFYSCPDKFQLPDLQFREPQSALLPSVQEKRLPLVRAGEAEATAAFAGDQLPPSGAVVEASVRAGAEVLLRGAAGEPYLVGWDQGAGRALVLAGQALGPQSGELHDDPAYAAFLADLLRSAAGGAAALVPQLRVRTCERGAFVRLLLPTGARLPEVPVARLGGGPGVRFADDGAGPAAFLPWTGAGAVAVVVDSGGVLLAEGAACPPLPRGPRAGRADRELAELVAVTGGSELAAPDAPATPGTARARQVTVHTAAFALAALALFALVLLLRRVPIERLAGTRLRAAGAAAAVLLLAVAGAAQQPPADEAAVRAAIDAELRRSGDLAGLAARWRDAPALHRYWLLRAAGDLDAAARLCEDPALAATHAGARAALLDVLGRPAEALAAFAAPAAGLPAAERGARWLERAVLQVAAGDRPAAEADLRAAVAAADQPGFAQQAGVVAAAFGFFDLALAWHRVGPEPGRESCQAALRRGLWQQRAGRPAAAGAEYELAFQRGSMQRDRGFALAMLVAVRRAAGTLPALADAWLRRAAGDGPALHPQEFATLVEVLRELGRARDGLRAIDRLDAAARAALGDLPLELAVDAGEPEAAIAQLRRALEADAGDAAARCSLALLLADLQRDAEAERVLRDGIPDARVRDLRRLCAAASELGMDGVVAAVAAAFTARAGAEGTEAFEGILLEVAHLRRQGQDGAAAARLLRARDAAARPQDRLRLAEQLESLGKGAEAIGLYARLWDEQGTEDVGMRLGWLLGESKVEADRQRAQAIFRQIWTQAGSAARRVQAEEHVLDLAAREGNLADFALELEARLGEPDAPNRPAIRDALVKIYTRARDTTGAVTILQQWARQEPQHEVAALQQLARVHLAAEEFRNHERALQRLIELDAEGELDYRQQLAMSALERGRPEDARRHIRGLLDNAGAPDTIALEFGAGIYTLAAMHEEAVRLYRRALALHPERVETWLLLGNALRAAGQRDAAVGAFQELLLRPLPDDLFVVAVDGLLNMEADRPVLAAAARAVRLRLAARPEQVFLHRVLQDLLEAMQDEPGRLQALEDTVTAAGEQRASFVRELMQEAASRRDWRSYAAHGRTLLLLGDEVPPAVFLSLGEALLHLGELDGAVRSFERARLGTDFAATEQRTAQLFEDAGRLAEAERIRLRLLRRTPGEAGAALAVARLAERQGAAARALPHWLQAAQQLLPAELEAARPAGGRGAAGVVRGERSGPAFADAFAGVLRCADDPRQAAALLDAIRAAARDGEPERRLAALALLRHLALAFSDAGLRAEVRAAEDEVLRGAAEPVRNEIRARRLLAGDLAGVRAVPAGALPTAEELRALVLDGDAAALQFAASKSKPGLLPDLARGLLRLGRRAEAQALLPLAEAAGAAGEAARDELRALLGLPAVRDRSRAQQRLEQALLRSGPLAGKVNAVAAALRELPDLPAGERAAHLLGLAEAAVAAKDPAAAERLLANAGSDLGAEIRAQLVELAFAGVDKPYHVQSRAVHLDALPAARAVELLRATLRQFRDEERRMQLLQLFGNPQVPEAVLLQLVPDCDPRGLQGVDRAVFTHGLERGRAGPAVLAALAARFAATMPDDPLTLLLQARTAGDASARRAMANALLPRLAGTRLGDRDEAVLNQLVRLIGAGDAAAQLAALPPQAALEVRIPLLVKAGDVAGAAEAYVAATRQKPGDTGLLYRAASYCEAEGLYDRAAELYRTAQRNSPTFYPYQAMQLAHLELRAGNPLGALAAVRAAKDPSQTNFRLVLRALAEVHDADVRRAALADALQQRTARGAWSGVVFSVVRSLGGGGRGGTADRLAAVLAPARLPPLAPATPDEAEEAPSDYDLLGFLPEGEAVARALLRTLDDGARSLDLGIYRGLLAAARRAGRGQQLVDAAVAALARAPHDAEAVRTVFAGAQVGLAVPPPVLRSVLREVAAAPRPAAANLGGLIALAAGGGETEFAAGVLRSLLQQRGGLVDMELRPWLAGLLAMGSRQLPAEALVLVRDPGLDGDAAADLGAALLLEHPDADAAAAAVAAGPAAGGGARQVRDGSALLPRCGALVARGEVDAAIGLLQDPETYWMSPNLLGARRLAAGAPPLERCREPAAVERFGEGLLALLAAADAERAAALARLGAVVAARLQAGGRAEAAASLRSRLGEAAASAGVAWRAADWLPD